MADSEVVVLVNPAGARISTSRMPNGAPRAEQTSDTSEPVQTFIADRPIAQIVEQYLVAKHCYRIE